jgi:hypothetical protein
MRVAPPPARPKYVHIEHPAIMYPSTELQAKGIARTKIANSEAEEAALIKQGYQRTQAPPPYVAPSSTKEEALALQASVYDAAFKQKAAELAAVQAKLSALASQFEIQKTERDQLARRLAHLTKRPTSDKEESEAAA